MQNSVIVCEYSMFRESEGDFQNSWGFVLTKFRSIKLTVTLVTTSNGFKFYAWQNTSAAGEIF